MSQLYQLAGGEQGIRSLAEAFYDRVLKDPLLLPLFRNPEDNHAERLAWFLTETLGGEPLHTKNRGGLRVVISAHFGLKISEQQRAQWVKHMYAACEELNLPEEFMINFKPFIESTSRFAASESH